MQILALYQVYLGTPPDSRQAIQEQILRQLASHLDTEKELLFQEIRRLGPLGQKFVGEAVLVRPASYSLQEHGPRVAKLPLASRPNLAWARERARGPHAALS